MDDPRPEPKWARVLRVLYNPDKRLYGTFDNEQELLEHISTRIDSIGETQIKNTLEYMDDVGLVEGYNRDADQFSLTKKGFDVAHERELDRTQAQRENERSQRSDEINGTIAGLTVVLVLTAFAQALGSVASVLQAELQQYLSASALIVAIIAILVAGWVIRNPVGWRETLRE